MDHMRISGTEPSSVIFSQICIKSSKSKYQKVPKQAEAKRDSVINPQNYNFNHDALQTLRINEVDRRTWLHVPSWTHWSTSSDTHQVVEIQIETSTRCIHHFKSD